MDGETVKSLLLFVSDSSDRRRLAFGPGLAAVAERAGWEFDCYYAARRLGRHFGGGDPDAAPEGTASGSLVAGGRHVEQLLSLAARFQIVAVAQASNPLRAALASVGAEVVDSDGDALDLYTRVYERLGQPLPRRAIVLDVHSPVASYMYPDVLSAPASLVFASRAEADVMSEVAEVAAPDGATIADVTAALAKRNAAWGRGFLLGDPDLVAAQLAKARRLRLLPLYGRPQTGVLARAADAVRGSGAVYGRQYDDHDFFELSRLGRSFQLVDPPPPFDATATAVAPPDVPSLEPDEPTDDELRNWASEGRVLVTLLFWSGMIREVDCLPAVLDAIASTGARGGLVATSATAEFGQQTLLPALQAPVERGGVGDRLELLLASAGEGVAAESLLGAEALRPALSQARSVTERLLGTRIRGWWPLLDAPLVDVKPSRLGWRGRRPVVRFSPRGPAVARDDASSQPTRRDVRGTVGDVVRRLHADAFLEAHRPFDSARPGELDTSIAAAVREAGFEYMWTKTAFGTPAVKFRDDEFVALTLTAGAWGGWSPFYAVDSVADLARAERRLRGGRPGWLVATIDTPLWAMSGEVYRRGAEFLALAEFAASGGRSGTLVNVTPNTVARYARLIR